MSADEGTPWAMRPSLTGSPGRRPPALQQLGPPDIGKAWLVSHLRRYCRAAGCICRARAKPRQHSLLEGSHGPHRLTGADQNDAESRGRPGHRPLVAQLAIDLDSTLELVDSVYSKERVVSSSFP